MIQAEKIKKEVNGQRGGVDHENLGREAFISRENVKLCNFFVFLLFGFLDVCNQNSHNGIVNCTKCIIMMCEKKII